jgi:hypothetical protein
MLWWPSYLYCVGQMTSRQGYYLLVSQSCVWLWRMAGNGWVPGSSHLLCTDACLPFGEDMNFSRSQTLHSDWPRQKWIHWVWYCLNFLPSFLPSFLSSFLPFFLQYWGLNLGITPWATPPALSMMGFLEIGSHQLFAQAGFKPWSSGSLPLSS